MKHYLWLYLCFVPYSVLFAVPLELDLIAREAQIEALTSRILIGEHFRKDPIKKTQAFLKRSPPFPPSPLRLLWVQAKSADLLLRGIDQRKMRIHQLNKSIPLKEISWPETEDFIKAWQEQFGYAFSPFRRKLSALSKEIKTKCKLFNFLFKRQTYFELKKQLSIIESLNEVLSIKTYTNLYLDRCEVNLLPVFSLRVASHQGDQKYYLLVNALYSSLLHDAKKELKALKERIFYNNSAK